MATVSALQIDLEREKCLLANGFVFATGEIVVLTPDAKISKRLTRDAAAEQDLGFASISEFCSASSDAWQVSAGETSREGQGFVALFRAGVAVWALILDWSEPFNALELDGRTIKAVSGDYPTRMRWKIPLADPLSLELEKTR
ncbi:MAG TPA: hypothetical protein VFG30_15885 [Polyangiales bacterium]|nr:hypothetical protein [Polyangiales bacterium]